MLFLPHPCRWRESGCRLRTRRERPPPRDGEWGEWLDLPGGHQSKGGSPTVPQGLGMAPFHKHQAPRLSSQLSGGHCRAGWENTASTEPWRREQMPPFCCSNISPPADVCTSAKHTNTGRGPARIPVQGRPVVCSPGDLRARQPASQRARGTPRASGHSRSGV